ncbi:hypothetical protein AN8155.2 [Aspergillus nidulans FGSC A4]|uniref:Uncharacterized protein n=1 Tax=Emericella nidulans (strain FGSC A4 / ATCC 38163 / CBS 112.46 / NRRL 194 / M139) TaxID=227321 RepID=Q5AU75_EMENI|nr:hypothetical protein [Aspergillus nidulans FGSC A4]EAA59177.1 hypothetical protein AN8155.2 [Aspergillus nidulans FGSC A4]CBF73993.1 TPA: conserved hypothetical protein [Aspergillus nidulans FGSC A4]|eukprot:XP_681424.1 hypothetical protein AN8155.2 [Aspergillus nidulans FGSC A4]
MSDSTVVLITGVARGIGQALAKAYLSRPNHTVLGTIRDPSAQSLSALSSHVPAQGSRLLLFTLESTTASHYADLVSSLKTAGITHLDLVIANAGVAYPAGTPASVDVEDVKNVFDVNALGTLRLFQALRGFLEVGSNNGRRVKWCPLPVFSALERKKKSVRLSLVQTEMGNKGAQKMGLKEAPNTVEEAITKTLAAKLNRDLRLMRGRRQIDSATREDTSGKFLNIIDGAEVPW